MRLIDADELKRTIEDRIDQIPANDFDVGWNNAINTAIDEIDNAPPVVNEYTKGFADGERSGRNFPLTDEEKAILVRQWRPKGEWIIDGHHRRCKECGEYFCMTDSEGNEIPSNFCPNCGVEMKGGAE